MEKKREYGIDLLRIAAMFMVTLLHVLNHGGVLKSVMGMRYYVAWFLNSSAFCAADCFAMVSGYVYVNARYRYTSIVMLWLQAVFYGVVLNAVYLLLAPGTIGREDFLRALKPILTGQYWYLTSYVFMFFLIPLMNRAVQTMGRKQLRACLLGMLGLYSVGQVVFKSGIYGTGFDAVWLSVMYLLGAYIKKYNTFEKITPERAAAGYLLCVIMAWFGSKRIRAALVTYYSPLIIGAGVFLFLMFRGLSIPRRVEKLVRTLSPLAFGTYLIQCHAQVWRSLEKRFQVLSPLPVPAFVLSILGAALGLFTVFLLIDSLRSLLFRLLKLKERLSRLEDKWLGDLWTAKE